MGLLDIPALLFSWADRQMASALPPVARLVLWAAVGAFVSIELYRLLSPQTRIRANQLEQRSLRHELDAYDGEFAGACPLIGRLLRTAAAQIVLVAPAALVASLPLVCLIVWISTAFGYQFPTPGTRVPVQVKESNYQAVWVAAKERLAPRVVVTDDAGRRVAETSVGAPVPSLHKRQWWNSLIGNPAGYLPPSAPVQRVDIELPRITVMSIGPGWVRGWEAAFFATLIIASLLLKYIRRIA
jgi:hypothetical protein